MVRVIMCGCNGKMGNVISELAAKDSEVSIVAGVDLFAQQKFDYPVYESILSCTEEADVVIDFSSTSRFEERMEYILTHRLPIVLCTTGFSENQLRQVKEASEQVAVLRSANMSLGVNVLMKLVAAAAKAFYGAGFDMEIVEKHHNQKVDAPSGTALALADAMQKVLDEEYAYVYDRSGKREKRAKNEIGISSVRGGNIVGEHEVIFAGPDEVIELKHTAYSKAIFGNGALQAAKFLKGKPAGMYNMGDVIGEV
mgnify:CR=1 FL=1